MSTPAPTWDSPDFAWDMPGLVWDSPAPAPAPKPKKKPFRRSPRPKHQPTPIPTITMPTFKYNVAPKSTGGFTTRAVRGASADETALLAAIATETGVTPVQAEAVIRAFLNKILACAAQCDWSPDFLGLINFRPTSGGSSLTPTGFHNADDINADVSLSFTSEAIRQWRSTLSLESLGEVGKVSPVIESVIRQSDGEVDKYLPGRMIQLRGDNLKLDQTDLTQGVFFTSGSNPEVRAVDYGALEPKTILVSVPSTLSGALSVRIAVFINGSVRSYTYMNPLTTP